MFNTNAHRIEREDFNLFRVYFNLPLNNIQKPIDNMFLLEIDVVVTAKSFNEAEELAKQSLIVHLKDLVNTLDK